MFVGWAAAHRGDPERGCRMVFESVYAHHEQGNRMFEPYWRAMLAETLWLANRGDEALAEVEYALANLADSGNNFWTAHLLKLKGDYRLAQSVPATEVEHWYQMAVNVAFEQDAKALELRVTTSLCRLWHQQNRAAEAYPLLANIYGWFSEGFDTPDLVEAKALLDELAAG